MIKSHIILSPLTLWLRQCTKIKDFRDANSYLKISITAILLLLSFVPFGQLQAANSSSLSLPPVLKADKIDVNQGNGIIKAIGNAELIKDKNTIFSDEMSYDKKNNFIDAKGNVRVLNRDTGNMLADYANVKDDMSSGYLDDAILIFNDGSYLQSPKINRVSDLRTVLKSPVYSICPNDIIANDNKKAGKKRDAISIKSRKTTIDRDRDRVIINSGFLRVYNVPIFYLPYISFALPSKERESGFLHPSYTSSEKLGAGVQIPYYFNISPNKDLTTIAQIHPNNNNYILTNNFRHLLKSGRYEAELELANNNIESSNTVNSDISKREVRWYGTSHGDLQLAENTGLEFRLDTVGDKDYLRDYHNVFVGYTVSEIDLNYIKGKNYHSIKTLRIQELENSKDEKEQPFALPIINSYIESKPKSFGEKYSLLSNFTAINRSSGMQYRRASLKPEVKIPYNAMGNLFELSTNVQGDFYNLENNFKTRVRDNNYNDNEVNYRPEVAINWRFPLIKRLKKSSIIIEPKANIIYSDYYNNFSAIPNEDSSDTELTQGNLFINDRFVGFDRNESGQRINYGINSYLFSPVGQFTLGLGQGYRNGNKVQDVKIRGFNDNNKSNIVGKFSYKLGSMVDVAYNFQLHESDYNNDVNEVVSNFTFKRATVNGNYILLKQSANNNQLREQINIGASLKVTNKWTGNVNFTKDLVTGKIITKRYGAVYDGCCMGFEFTFLESNIGDFIKPEASYNIGFTIKNL